MKIDKTTSLLYAEDGFYQKLLEDEFRFLKSKLRRVKDTDKEGDVRKALRVARSKIFDAEDLLEEYIVPCYELSTQLAAMGFPRAAKTLEKLLR